MNPLCPCHGLPMGWQRDKRLKAGGTWECREKRRVYNKTRSAQRVAWVQAKRETDPLYRIADQLRHRRMKALRRKAARHLSEEGPWQGIERRTTPIFGGTECAEPSRRKST